VRVTLGMRSAALALACCGFAQGQSPIPKELEGWQSWVQDGQEFRRCPFLANTDGSAESNRICAWPGRLNLELNQSGGSFSQTWVTYTEGWVPLPGNLDYWPRAVTINGAAAAVVARDGIPQIRASEGNFTIAGRFAWVKRPESLPIPAQTGLVSLSLDGQKVEQADRPDNAVWLGKRRDAEVAQQLEIRVYRLLTDGIPATLNTRVLLQAAGDAREEVFPAILPQGFDAMSLDSELPAHLGADGRLHVQVRAGNWTISVLARAASELGKFTIPDAQGQWPKQEIWSYAVNDRLRIAALEGGEGIDPTQANVPEEWRQYPSYRISSGGAVQIDERSRGMSPQEVNHLSLQRRLYLDFARRGFTVIDQISGQMRNGWRLDMRAPYRLQHAASGADNLLVTESGGGALTGVELRTPELNLSTAARITVAGGRLPASGWNERFDHVAGVLDLPPGHRLLAAFGADSAPDSWVEKWGLLDLFLLALTTVIALRIFGGGYAAVTFAAVVLVHQENQLLVWLILCVLVATVSMRAAPVGWPRSLATWLRRLLLAALLLASIPFAVVQLRFAVYPQLADFGGRVLEELSAQPLAATAIAPTAYRAVPAFAPPPPAPKLEEVVVTGSRRPAESIGSLSSAQQLSSQQRFAPGTLVQAGPGVPHWRYAEYSFNWSGPVDAAQTVRFVILPPWLVGIWRVLGVVLLAALFVRLLRAGLDAGLDVKAGWQRLFATRGAAAVSLLLFAGTMLGTTVHAEGTPDRELLNALKNRLSRPAKCVPNCSEIMAARVTLSPAALEASLDVAALSAVAVELPSLAQRFDPDTVAVDGIPVSGVYRDSDQQIWIALKPGAHTVTLAGRMPAGDSTQVLFPQVPRAIAVSGEGWDVSGVNAGKLLGNTIELLRHRTAGRDADSSAAAAQFPPYVRIRREFSLDLDWSVKTTVQRLAPEKGGFTLEVPLLKGESVLTNGIETNNGTRVSAGFESNADEFTWRSGLPYSDTLTLTAADGKPWSEVWIFSVSPTWQVEFAGVPAAMPENLRAGEWTFEYFPRAGETLTLKISRPPAAQGGTLAIDDAALEFDVGKRSTNTVLHFNYRSTRGDRHTVKLPPAVRVTAVTADGEAVPVRAEKGELPLALLPGAHHIEIDWQSVGGAALITRLPAVDLQVPSSNVDTVVRMPDDRWVLYAGGSGIGPAILYWGELIIFFFVALGLGRTPRAPLRSREWLILGLGLSTFSWSALLLFAVWIFAMRWREGIAVEQLSRRRFNLLQVLLILLSIAAVLSLVAAIPFGLLANPDMHVAGSGQQANNLSWFNDQAPGVLPTPWVLSLSLWWYKAAMLLWALWLAFALVRWLPIAWKALGSGGFWRKTQRAAAPPLVITIGVAVALGVVVTHRVSAAPGPPASGTAEPIVHDSRLGVSWLTDGNLPATQSFGVPGINKSGSMDYATALRWVLAMNTSNNGSGYLGHNNWQLPTTPDTDGRCERTGRHGESFGFHCSAGALGSLYYETWGLQEPNTAVAIPHGATGPFSNFQPYLYWSKSAASDPKQGFVSFSFNTGFQGANVWRNHLYVLPMIKGKLAGTAAATAGGLQVNPGGQTIFDPASQVTWLANANLAAEQTFGVAGITADGSMDHNTAVLWIDAMNKADYGRGFLGQTQWDLPDTGPPDPSCSMKGTTGFDCSASAMGGLYYKQLGLRRGEPAVATPDMKVGAFHNIQPYLYWSCAADNVQSVCRANGPAEGFEWNFSFGNGFQGTNLARNYLYVMVYYPDSASKPAVH
jgi:hypothetical protein